MSTVHRRHKYSPSPDMVGLNDDELGVIFSSISDAKDRNSISLVCKQWLRVEGLTRTSLRFRAGNLPKFILRFPNLTTFESSAPLDDLDAFSLAYHCRKIETLNLNFDSDSACSDKVDITYKGFQAIAKMCPNLSVLLLQNRRSVDHLWIYSLAAHSCNLTYLDLSGCTNITDLALIPLGGMDSIQTLILQGCSSITDTSLAILASCPLSKSLRKLILSGCNRITLVGVVFLSGMLSLEELSLADCGSKISQLSGIALSGIQSLKKVDLSGLTVTDFTLQTVAEECKGLVELTINGCTNVTGVGISALAAHKSLEVFVMDSCEAVSVESINTLVLECSSLKCIALDRKLIARIPLPMKEVISNRCLLTWV